MTLYKAQSLILTLAIFLYYSLLAVVSPSYRTICITMLFLSSAILYYLYKRADGSLFKYRLDINAPFVSVIAVIVCTQVPQILIGKFIRSFDVYSGVISTSIYSISLLVAVLVMLKFGILKLPHKAYSKISKKISIYIIGSIAAAILFYINAVTTNSDGVSVTYYDYIMGLILILTGATLEEFVFRIFLITALLAKGVSKYSAVVLSTSLFVLFHLVPSISVPLLDGDWIGLIEYARTFVTSLYWIIFMGLLLGYIWVETGSVMFVIAIHFAANYGTIVSGGLGVL